MVGSQGDDGSENNVTDFGKSQTNKNPNTKWKKRGDPQKMDNSDNENYNKGPDPHMHAVQYLDGSAEIRTFGKNPGKYVYNSWGGHKFEYQDGSSIEHNSGIHHGSTTTGNRIATNNGNVDDINGKSQRTNTFAKGGTAHGSGTGGTAHASDGPYGAGSTGTASVNYMAADSRGNFKADKALYFIAGRDKQKTKVTMRPDGSILIESEGADVKVKANGTLKFQGGKGSSQITINDEGISLKAGSKISMAASSLEVGVGSYKWQPVAGQSPEGLRKLKPPITTQSEQGAFSDAQMSKNGSQGSTEDQPKQQQCPNNYIWSAHYNKCVLICPQGQEWNEQQQKCVLVNTQGLFS